MTVSAPQKFNLSTCETLPQSVADMAVWHLVTCFCVPCDVCPGVGLFSLVLGLVCAQCCCRNTAHTPRSRNKLMDLEMD